MVDKESGIADDKPVMDAFARFQNHLKRRFMLGIVVFLPFALTFWIMLKFITFSKAQLTRPLDALLRHVLPNEFIIEYLTNEKTGRLYWNLEYLIVAISIILAILALYLVGLISATIIGRRSIQLGERAFKHIPGVEFCYKTIKQVTEIVSMPRSRAFQKVVAIEYPRKGIRALAFFSGVTRLPETGEIMINVFLPTTPNPTSGFLLLIRPDEVMDTNLVISDATRFIISGGVVSLDNLQLRPFPIEEYQGGFIERRHVDASFKGSERRGEDAPDAGRNAN